MQKALLDMTGWVRMRMPQIGPMLIVCGLMRRSALQQKQPFRILTRLRHSWRCVVVQSQS